MISRSLLTIGGILVLITGLYLVLDSDLGVQRLLRCLGHPRDPGPAGARPRLLPSQRPARLRRHGATSRAPADRRSRTRRGVRRILEPQCPDGPDRRPDRDPHHLRDGGQAVPVGVDGRVCGALAPESRTRDVHAEVALAGQARSATAIAAAASTAPASNRACGCSEPITEARLDALITEERDAAERVEQRRPSRSRTPMDRSDRADRERRADGADRQERPFEQIDRAESPDHRESESPD